MPFDSGFGRVFYPLATFGIVVRVLNAIARYNLIDCDPAPVPDRHRHTKDLSSAFLNLHWQGPVNQPYWGSLWDFGGP